MSKLVPKLRFKEFSGEWEEKSFSNFIDSYKGGAPLKPSDFVEKSNYEVIPKKSIQSGGKLILDKNNPTYCSESFFTKNKNNIVDNSYLITTLRDLVPTGPSIGYIVKNNNKNKLMLAQGVYGFIINSKLNSDFIIQFSNSLEYRRLMQKIMVGSTQVHIRNQIFFSINLILPKQKEQQKIANCLSSLDNLIEAQNKKVEALKEYKKGLMQQLFPQEGKTVPKLRFDGFSWEWEEKEVNDVFDILAGGDVPKKELSDKKTQEYNIPILSNGIAEKSLYGWTNKAKIDKPSLTISARGTIGWTSLQEKPFFPIVRLIVLTPKIKINFIYSYYYMKKIENDYKYAKVGIPQLTKPMIKNTKLMIPKPKEQEKIANCLSSLDNLIEAQNKKAEALKEHKKGLMQQLFVSSERGHE